MAHRAVFLHHRSLLRVRHGTFLRHTGGRAESQHCDCGNHQTDRHIEPAIPPEPPAKRSELYQRDPISPAVFRLISGDTVTNMSLLEQAGLIGFSVMMFGLALIARMTQAKLAPKRLQQFVHGRWPRK